MDASELIEPVFSRKRPAAPVADLPVEPAAQVTPTPPTPGVPVPPTEEHGIAYDMATGLAHGAEGAVIGAREVVRSIGRAVIPESLQQESLKGPLSYSTKAPTGTMGKLTDDLTRFGLGFAAGGPILKGVGLATQVAKGGLAINALQSAVGTALVADPQQARLSNIIQDHPYLANPVSDYLSAHPEDSFAEGKFKAALEDTLTSGVAGLAFKTFSAAKTTMFPAKVPVAPFVPDIGPAPRMLADSTVLGKHLGIDTDVLIGSLHTNPSLGATVPEVMASNRGILDVKSSHLAQVAQKSLLTGENTSDAFSLLHDLHGDISHLRARTLGETVAKTDPTQGIERFIAHAGGRDQALAKLVSLGDSPAGLTQFARGLDHIPEVPTHLAGIVDKHNTYWYASVLSQISTHVINPLTTATNLLVQPLNLVAGGSIRRDSAAIKEGLAMYKGLGNHIFESFAAAKAMYKGESLGLGGHYSADEIASSTLKASPEGLWGKMLQVPGKMLKSEDEFFKQIAYRSHVKTQVAREGMDLVQAGTMSAKDLDGYIANKFQAAFDNEGRGLNKPAADYAARATFNQDLKMETWMGAKSISEGIEELAAGQPLLRSFILPFVRVPMNIMRQVIDYTPILGQVKAQFWKDMSAGGTVKTEALGRLGLGTAFWTGAGMLAYDGKITGRASTDPQVAKLQRVNGWQPYSIVVQHDDGTTTYISYRRFAPFGSVLGLAADMAQVMSDLPENEQHTLASMASLSMLNNLASQTYLKGLVDTLDVVNSNDPQKIQHLLSNRIASYVPGILSSVQPDVEHKEFQGYLDQAMGKIPGFSQTIEARRDILGDKVVPTMGYPQSVFNPFTISQTKNSPVRDELSRLAHSDGEAQFTNPPSKKDNVDLTTFKNAQGQSAYDRWMELSGVGLEESLGQRMNSERYKRGTDGDSAYQEGSRTIMVKQVLHHHRDRAFYKMKQEFPEVREALKLDRQNKGDMRQGREVRNPIEKILDFGK